jgi:hypothetical protein
MSRGDYLIVTSDHTRTQVNERLGSQQSPFLCLR